MQLLEIKNRHSTVILNRKLLSFDFYGHHSSSIKKEKIKFILPWCGEFGDYLGGELGLLLETILTKTNPAC